MSLCPLIAIFSFEALRVNRTVRFSSMAAVVAMSFVMGATAPAQAQVTAFRQAVAESVAMDDELAAFYRARDFASIWTGSDEVAQARRNALLGAFADAPLHGLPAEKFDPNALIARLQSAKTAYEQGAMEVELSELFLTYARDVQTGILNPNSVLDAIKREVPVHDRIETLNGFLAADPVQFLRSLAPQSAEYARLMRSKMRLEHQMARGGWGDTVPEATLRPGDAGAAVVALRNRLIAMGYMERSVTATYDATLQAAVQKFQQYNGLTADGVAGGSTIVELNRPIEDRLRSVIVAMERERWLNITRGERHIWVNLTDFTAKIIDNDIVTFETRSVIGANSDDRQSPEFSDLMEFMVINPSWYVPRSIIVNEYLPRLQADAGAVGHLQVVASNGQVVNRENGFSQYSASSFPFSMRQPPGPSNALGSVKFMFPNRYNIYLHDTPAQNLFAREVRAFSHGCIRLDDPHDFAYALLAKQTSDPVDYFQSRLRTGTETRVDLETPVPVHLDYRTAFTNVDGSLQYRRDIYGRDAVIWNALEHEGVAAGGVQG
jgi:murein L,D-transpeptidase YcbB/YkuD